MHRLAIFSSGTGSNAGAIIRHFQDDPAVEVALLICNNPRAKVLDVGHQFKIDAIVIDKQSFYQDSSLLDSLKTYRIDFIVLAGFLWMIPQYLLDQYPNRIINIHPALLPKFGGKGMYGSKVHEAVLAAGEKETGITIHYVNEKYDEGEVIFQAKCPVDKHLDTPETVRKKVQALEHKFYPQIIGQLLSEG